MKWEEDQAVLKQQKERIQVLMDGNYCLMTIISTLKMELKDVYRKFESLSKFVKMFTSETQSLDNLLNDGKPMSDKKGLGFFGQCSSSGKSSTVFIHASYSKNKSEEKAVFS